VPPERAVFSVVVAVVIAESALVVAVVIAPGSAGA
jgi:hypothetical protein